MRPISLCLTVSLLAGRTAVASPLAREQAAWSTPPLSSTDDSPEPRNKEMEALLNKYAPIVKLSAVEAFYPSSIEYMLPHYSFMEDRNGNKEDLNATLLTPPLLDRLPNFGRDQYLSIPEEHNPQPFLFDEEAAYLFGPAGQDGDMKRNPDGREIVEEDIYGFWVDQRNDVVDLWYWTFYPFNYGKPVGPFGILGNHVGDWEHLRVRTLNGTAISADYHSHNGGAFSSGTVRWSDVEQIDGRPVAYSAAGSHGLWPTPGDHVFANLLNRFRLVDITDDDGALWDTKDHVVASRFWDGPRSRRKIWHHGDRSWLNFRGLWGNSGETDCWWHRVVGICQLVDAPPGPNRWFGVTPDCITAPLAWETSTYSFYLSISAVGWAEQRNVAAVQVEQICARPRRRKDDSDDDDDLARGAVGDRIVDYVHDETKEEDLTTWSISAMTPFRHHERHEVNLLPCRGVQSAVKAYKISLCLKDGKCISTSYERKICTYETGKKGYRFGNAATVDDIDEWMWNLGP